MYLASLSNEKKHLFLDLEIHMSKIDGDFSEEEKRIIDTHCAEMHIDNNGYENELSIDEIFHKLREECAVAEKKIVFLELVAVVLADGIYDSKEKMIVNNLARNLAMTEKDVTQAFDIVTNLKKYYKACAEFIKEA